MWPIFREFTQCTMHQGLSFLEKAITKCLILEIDFSANVHLIHVFLDGALLNSQKLENEVFKFFTDKTFFFYMI